ncbi:MAG: hypothetical protein ACW99R_14300 [Candidatus Hodarchaeales archaeon]|jgi:tetratricopeptide (TPR) repeat protein
MVNKEDIQNLLKHNKFREALSVINSAENTKDIDLADRLAFKLLKSQVLVQIGKTEKGLNLADKILARVRTQIEGNPLLLVDAIITRIEALRWAKKLSSTYSRIELTRYLQMIEEGERNLENVSNLESLECAERTAILLRNKGLIYLSLGEFGLAENYLQASISLYETLDKKTELVEVLVDFATIFEFQTDYNRQIAIFQTCLKLNKLLEDQEGIAETFLNFAKVYQNREELETASNYIQSSLQIINELPRSFRVARLFFNIGIFFHKMRDGTRDCLLSLQKSLSLSEKLDDTDGVQLCYHLLGDVHQYSKGDLNKALEFYKRSQALFEEGGRIIVHCWNLLDTGNLYHLKGALHSALANFQKAIPLLEKISDDFYFCQTFLHIGRVYRSKDNSSKAVDYYKRCLKELDERNLRFGQETEGLAYYELISVMLDKKDTNRAKKYFERFSQFFEKKTQNKRFLNQWYKLAEALILKTSIRIKDKARAQQLFQEIIDDPHVKLNLLNYLADSKKTAMLNLCELLIFELKSSSDELTEDNEFFQEVKQILSNLASLAKEQHSFPLLVDVTILQAKLTLIEGYPTNAMQFLAQAKISAEKYDLKFLYKRVITEENHLTTQLSVWENLIQENAPLKKRLAQAQVEKYLLEAKRMVSLAYQPSKSEI